MGVKKFFSDFKTFAMRGNILDLAIGVMIGGAFGKIVSSLVSDIFTPLIGLITGGQNFNGLFIALDGKSYPNAQAAVDAGVGTLNYGAFLTNILDFILIALCIFVLLRIIQKFMPAKPEVPKAEPRRCPYCFSEVNEKAVRCPHCTSDISQP